MGTERQEAEFCQHTVMCNVALLNSRLSDVIWTYGHPNVHKSVSVCVYVCVRPTLLCA